MLLTPQLVQDQSIVANEAIRFPAPFYMNLYPDDSHWPDCKPVRVRLEALDEGVPRRF